MANAVRWRIPKGQRFAFADFEDGIVMFDGWAGSTHLLNATAAETLSVVEGSPDLSTDAIYRVLLDRLELDAAALPLDAVDELLWQLENLGLVSTA